MNLFDQLVTEAIQHTKQLSTLRMVVEKELLHHDIIREMSRAGLLKQLTFMGGTCLRACYGSDRLSEDLDFTGGEDFNKSLLSHLADVLTKQLKAKYGLQIDVSEPKRETGNVDTWKFKIITRPEQSSMPMQRINIDICAIPSYDKKPSVLRNHYGVDMGKNHQQTQEVFFEKLLLKRGELQKNKQLKADFNQEIRRFLPIDIVKTTIDVDDFWSYIKQASVDTCDYVVFQLNETGGN